VASSVPILTPESPIQTPSVSRTPSKRNKTFFERFNETTPSTLASSPQSPTNQQQQSIDLSTSLIDPSTRLRRKFTFRRSFRHAPHNKAGDIDDGIRLVLWFPFQNFSLRVIFILHAIKMIDDFLSPNTV
jgi:hypothetical protein